MKRALVIVATSLVIAVAIVLLAGCAPGSVKPGPLPKTVTVVVKETVPVPAWASAQLPKPARKDSTVAGHLSHENALDGFVDLLMCERGLLAQLGTGKPIDPTTCTKAP